jgi:hypothetical protein
MRRHHYEFNTCKGASGPHDFAVRSSRARQSQPSRPPLPAPTFVTMANAPLTGRDGGNTQVICVERKQKYFCKRGWTQYRVICPIGRTNRYSRHLRGERGALWRPILDFLHPDRNNCARFVLPPWPIAPNNPSSKFSTTAAHCQLVTYYRRRPLKKVFILTKFSFGNELAIFQTNPFDPAGHWATFLPSMVPVHSRYD